MIGFEPRLCALRGPAAETVFFVSPHRRFAREARWRPKEAIVLEVRIRAL